MSTKQRPATPLRVVFGATMWHLKDADNYSIATGKDSSDGERMESIARAANAYPRLVEALRNLMLRCDGEEGIRADGSNIQTIEASAILNELGEL